MSFSVYSLSLLKGSTKIQAKILQKPLKKQCTNMVFVKQSLCKFLVAFSIFVLSVSLNIASKDNVEVSECKHDCRHQRQFEGVEARIVLENENPYVFGNEDFSTLFKTQEGEMKVLKKFTERSELFKGIENIRVLRFEANPHTFVIPSHWDSDILFFVAHGRGTITLVFEERIESFNVEKGHLMTIPAGITFYMINRDDQEKLVLTGFIKPIANLGNFVPFFGVGGQDPESFYFAFSTDVLETVFNISSDRLQKLFSQQRKGVIVKASKDQIKSLTAGNDTQLPLGGNYCLDKYGPCQIFSFPGQDSELGKLFMVIPTTYLKLQDLDMYISFSITSKGCMNTPFHSTRVTKVIVVINGRGRFEMATPYYEEGSTRIHYKKMSAELKRGMVLVVPPGHALVLMASLEENLENVNFEFYAKENAKFSFGGINNIMKNFEKEAKELSFATSVEEVDYVLNKQHQDFFMVGPSKLQGRDTAAF